MRPAAAPDYRNQRNASPEGAGIARARFHAFIEGEDDELLAAASRPAGLTIDEADDIDPDTATAVARRVLEETELIGFWVAWHRAGGFNGLQHAGWHRATIFRKMRRFRAHYDAHPDTHTFDWLQPDFETLWHHNLQHRAETNIDPT